MKVERIEGVSDYRVNLTRVQRKEIPRRNEIERVIDELARRSMRRKGLLTRIKAFYKAVEKSLINMLG